MFCNFFVRNDLIEDNCNFQFPTSKSGIKAGNYEQIAGCTKTKYYECLENGNFKMKACGKHYRSEFRCIKEFKTSTEDAKVLKVRCKFVFGSLKEESTIIQIHDNPAISGINKPLLRIAWIKDRKGVKNHFWAIFKDSYDPNDGKYKYYDLGEYVYDFIDWKVVVKNNNVYIHRNENEYNASHNVEYYSEASNYFKVGIYNQDDGCGSNELESVWFNTKISD